MDDFIILPDDKTMEKLAAEYAKIKAKTFSAPTAEIYESESTVAPSAEKYATHPPQNCYFLLTLISAAILKSTKPK